MGRTVRVGLKAHVGLVFEPVWHDPSVLGFLVTPPRARLGFAGIGFHFSDARVPSLSDRRILMTNRGLLGILAIASLAGSACAVVTMSLSDEFDDSALIRSISQTEETKTARGEFNRFRETFAKKQQLEIEKQLGKPRAKPPMIYALPVAEPRQLVTSGINLLSKDSKRHTEFYPVDDIGAIEVWYGFDGKSVEAIVIYLKVDNAFPKLTEKNLTERLAWDKDRFNQMLKVIEKRQRRN
jgi:hypothetical protein